METSTTTIRGTEGEKILEVGRERGFEPERGASEFE
jgi:hypothetical protein